MIDITTLLTPVTTDDQLAQFIATLETLGVPASSWRAGGSLRTILRVVAGAYAGFSTSILGFVQAGFLETSTAGWLTLLAQSVYGVTRIPATFATGNITLHNTGGGIFSLTAGQLVALNSVTGKSYTNTGSITLNPGDILVAPVQAIELGAASNADPATVTSLVTALPSVTVTNVSAIVGSDAEADPDLRARCIAKLGVISGLGPRGAYKFAVQSAVRSDGSPVDINRLRISPSSSTGVVTVWVASPSGAPISSDLPFISTSIETYARPDTVTVNLVAANPVALSGTINVYAVTTPGLTSDGLAALVDAALLAWISSYPIGGIAKPSTTQGYLYASGITGTVKSAHSAIFAVDGIGSDIAMADGDVATFAATLNIRFEDVLS